MQKSKFRGAVAGVSVGLVAFGTVATAAFFASGTLSAQTTAGTVTMGEVTATVDADLYPGYLEDITVTFTNPNPVDVRINGVTLKEIQADEQYKTYLIAPAQLSLASNATNGFANLSLAPGASATVTIPEAVGLKSTTPNQYAGNAYQGEEATLVYNVQYTVVGQETKALEGTAVG